MGEHAADPTVVVVVGNPQPGSRTAGAAAALGDRIAGSMGVDGPALIDLAELAPALLSWGDPIVESARRAVTGASAVVVASPTYKASFTGLLKLFLDRFDHGELREVPLVVPMMTGGGAAHSLAVEVHLRPVLVEIGARMPTAGLYLSGTAIDDPGPALDDWWATESAVITAAAPR